MSNVHTILSQLAAKDIRLHAEAGKLKINAPKGALDAAMKQLLKAHKDEILAFLEANTGQKVAPIPVADRTQALPLSFAQQRLWFLHQMDSEHAAYHMTSAFRFKGGFQRVILLDSLATIVARHEVLRTRFEAIDGKPVQVVTPELELPLRESTLAAGADLQQVMADFFAQPFDLEAGPLFRIHLITVHQNETLLLLAMHHIISDGWSMGVLGQELTQAYAALAAGKAPALAPLPIQYADYSAWQRQRLSEGGLQQQLRWWRDYLQDAPPLLELPTDRPRPAMQTYTGHHFAFELDSDLTRNLRGLAKQSGTTLFMVLDTAFVVLLSRYANSDQVVIGSPAANRERSEVANLIGFFVNTLALRFDLSGKPSFLQLLERVKADALKAFDRADVPFDQLVEQLRPQRDLAHSPIFQVMFTLQNTPAAGVQLDSLQIEPLDVTAQTAMFDLTLNVEEHAQHMSAALQYNTDLFDDETMATLAQRFNHLLRQLVATPERVLGTVPLLTAAEQSQLQAWNQTQHAVEDTADVVSAIYAQAAATPNTVALQMGSESLTYARLVADVEQLASALQAQGVTQESVVALCFERSFAMITSMLAVMRAGGAYVPLDPAAPADRLRYMLADAQASLLLHGDELSLENPNLPTFTPAAIIAANGCSALVPPALDPRQQAYLIYTSGSTGKPKGVVVPHAALSHHMAWFLATFQITPADRLLNKTPYIFDASVWETFAPLMRGARLVLAPPGAHRDPAALLQAISEHQITQVQLVPSQLRMLLAQPDRKTTALTRVFCGGEALERSLIEAVAQRWQATVVNLYGPTETTIQVLSQRYAPHETPNSVAIGRPAWNTQTHVLDAQLNPVAPGIAGELFIAGRNLTRGYAHKPDQTALRYLPNPFSQVASDRMYRTGDRVVQQRDGALRYLGRTDQQVKLRGFRIELGEIEAACRATHGVAEAVVILRQPSNQLIAFVQPQASRFFDSHVANQAQSDLTFEGASLRQALAKNLIEYMLPARFVPVENMPTTAGGKLDRRALQSLAEKVTLHRSGADFQAPQGESECALAELWQDLLAVERCSRNDHFFDLGGHSLLATQLLARIRERFAAHLELRDLFKAPILKDMAALISRDSGVQAAPIEALPRGGAFPLSFAQQRLWFLDNLEPGKAFYNIPFTMRMQGPLNATAFERSLRLIHQRHESLRTVFATEHGDPVQLILEDQPLAFQKHDLRDLAEAERENRAHAMVHADVNSGFDLSTGPLLRVNLIQLADDDHILVMVMHHIISDGWSSGVLFRELSETYRALAADQQPNLPALAIQYADFSAWQREQFEGGVLSDQLDYWKAQLKGAPQVLELPTDFPRPPVETFTGDVVTGVIPKHLKDATLDLSVRYGATPFMTLLTAFSVMLQRYANQKDMVIGSPIANRQRSELEGLIGFFANTLALCADFSDEQGIEPSFETMLQRIKTTALAAFANQDLPFEKLVEELQPVRDMSRAPIFQVMFVLQNAPQDAKAIEGLTFTPFEHHANMAKFDMTLFLMEAPEGFHYTFEYNTDLFERETAERMMAQYQVLLRHALSAPQTPVSRLPMLPQNEAKLLLETWHHRAVDYGVFKSFRDQIEAQAKAHPERIALRMYDDQLTYAELDQQANELAAHLAQRGIGTDDIVGIMLERSCAMAVSFLAVLKAGGAVVALDPTYPKSRLAFVIGDAHIKVLITENQYLAQIPTDGIEIFNIEDTHAAPTVAVPRPEVSDDHLLYVIYTSGSTGQPKGIGVTHRSLLNLMTWQQQEAGLDAAAVTLQFAAFGFCVSFQEMLSAWIAGGSVVIAGEDERRDPERLLRYCINHGVERLHLPFAALKELAVVALASDDIPTTLRDVISAGEQLQITDAIRTLFKRLPGCRLHNQYGASETHVITSEILAGDAEHWPVLPPAGRPVANCEIYLLDDHLQPVPIGAPGVIYAAGDCLPRGYLNRADLNLEKLPPHPFSQAEGARIYRTGDLARYRKDGVIQYLGRADAMVKVRGYRVEPGEIETCMREHEAIADIAVIPLLDDSNAWFLTAYVVAKGGEVDFGELRSWLKERLPAFMVPQVFMAIDALPTTANGKLDREALPQPEMNTRQAQRPYVTPEGDIELAVAGVYGAVLGLEKVGAEDDFFELGGHSLLATRVLSQLREQFQAELPLKLLFEEPSVRGLAKRIARAEQASQIVIEPAEALSDGGFPLSFAQERMWFLYQFEGPNPALNVNAATGLRGALDLAAAQRAVQQLLERHHTLRTVFRAVDGEPRQMVTEVPEKPIAVYDLRHMAEDAKQAEWARIKLQEAAFAFRLETGPLARFSLVRMQDDLAMLLVMTHHIVSDGWSFSVMLNEISQLYATALQHAPLEGRTQALQYSDYAAWQRTRFAGERLQKQLAYWQDKLADHQTQADLPADHPRTAERKFKPASVQLAAGQTWSDGLKALAQQQQTTPFMVMQAGLKGLMARLTGESDVCVGTPVAGRHIKQTESMVGLFLNTLVLRDQVNLAGDFTSLLEGVKQTTLDAFDHQDIPFEKLIAELLPERDTSRNPFFQVFLNMLNLPDAPAPAAGLSFETVDLPEVGAKFDITLYISETHNGFQFNAVYDAGLYSATRMQGFLAQWVQLLEQAINAPQQPLQSFDLITPEARALLPNPTHAFAGTPFRSVPQYFASAAEAAQDAIAVRDEKRSLSYAQLRQATNQVTHGLIQGGVAQGDVTAIWAQRSADLLPAVLGTLAAGSAFLILDPAYPAARLADYIELSQPQALLVLNDAEALPAELEPSMANIPLRLQLPLSAGAVSEQQAIDIVPGDLAYLSFTSGSTGKPKAIEGCHGGLSHYIPWMNQRFQFSADDRFSMLSGLAHDPLQRDMFTPLAVGASIVIPNPEEMVPDRLAAWVKRERITVAHLTPAMSRILTQAKQIQLEHLRLVFLVGEALTRAEVARLKRLAPQATIVNFYGSTETQRAVSYYSMAQALPQHAPEVVPLGRGIADVQLLIVNAHGSLASVGEPGEILVRAPYVARGYRGGSAGDAARFCVHPFAPDSGERLYRTGDLGHYLPDGNVASLGRIDRQIKLRGFRIELAEIESVLEGHPAVASAVVIADDDCEILAAYLVAADSKLDKGAVRAWLAERLPAYMVPAWFGLVEQLPLTQNGKVDYAALPKPQLTQAAEAEPLVGTTQQLLANIWREVLDVEVSDAGASFFALGGHSLKATTVASRVRDVFGVDLSLRWIFENPTLAHVAERIDAAKQGSQSHVMPLLSQEHDQANMPVSYAQQRLWFLDQLEGPSATYNMVSALRLRGTLNPDALQRAVALVVERHQILRLTYPAVDGKPVAVLGQEAWNPLTIEAQAVAADDMQSLIDAEAQKPFDLGQDPLLRLRLVSIGTDEHVLIAVMHHIIADGWSVGVFVREFSTAYAAFCQKGDLAALPQLDISFADYAAWQKARMEAGLLQQQLTYWREQLDGMPAQLALPLDAERKQATRFNGATFDVAIEGTLRAALEQLAAQSGTTLYMVLLAGFAATLQRFCDQDDLCVGTPISNRNRSEVENLIGFFANTLALRIDLSGDGLSFHALLARVREVTLNAYAHQDVPFDAVVDEVKPDRDHLVHPLFQVMCILQNASDALLELPDLDVEVLDVADDTAKFDLVFNMHEGEDQLFNAISYNADIFEKATVMRIWQAYLSLLRQATSQPDAALLKLDLDLASYETNDATVILDRAGKLAPLGVRGEVYIVRDGERTPTGEQGYRRADGQLIRQPKTQGQVLLDGEVVDTFAVEAVLRRQANVRDVCVLSKAGDAGTTLIAYVVASGPFQPQQLRAAVGDVDITPLSVSHIPRSANGAIAVEKLRSLPMVDADAALQVRDQLAALAGVRAAEVLLVDRTIEPAPLLHIDDLLAPQLRGVVADEAVVESQSSADVSEKVGPPAEVSGGPAITPMVEHLAELLERTAKLQPQNGVGFLPSGDFMTYAELLEKAQRIAASLRASGEQPGAPVLFQLSDNAAFIAAFWGCVWAGLVPVPVAVAPSYSKPNGGLNKLQHAWRMLGEPPILATQDLVEPIANLHAVLDFKGFTVIPFEGLENGEMMAQPELRDAREPALMLLTSGSTGKPKAVQQSAYALLHRSAAVMAQNGFSPEDRTLNWMPLDHVGGIVMFHLRDLYVGATQYHAPTQTVLEDPLLWLDWLSRKQISATWAPNFAYGLINDRLASAEVRPWDLHKLRFILNGGEAVVAKTALRFMQNLTPFGLPQTAMFPAWGMSETCSGVVYNAAFSAETAHEQDDAVVVGRPVPGFNVRIANDQGQPVAMGETGRLLVRGPSVTLGYFGNINAEAFSDDGWFDTGDLGVLREGLLTIAGRAKEDIIINGINYAASEIEALVEEEADVTVSFTAACAVRPAGSQTDQLAVFFHTPLQQDAWVDLLARIHERVLQGAGVAPDVLIPMDQGAIPKTGIGKIQRSQLRTAFENGAFDITRKQVDLLLGNRNTLPNWFFQRIWRPAKLRNKRREGAAEKVLILADGYGVAAALQQRLEGEGCRTRVLQGAVTLAGIADSINALGGLDTAFVLRGLDQPQPAQTAANLRDASLFAVLYLLQAAERCGVAQLKLVAATCNSLSTGREAKLMPTHGALAGLLKTVPLEMDWVRCHQIDLDVVDDSEHVAQILAHERAAEEPEVAYRNAVRLVPSLAQLSLSDTQESPVARDGFFLISGGLGGLGLVLAQQLLERYNAHVLLIGRRSLDDPALQERRDAFMQLQKHHGRILYQVADVTDLKALQKATQHAETVFGTSLTGIFHLAGAGNLAYHWTVADQHRILSESAATFHMMTRPKIDGAHNLYRLIEQRPDALFVGFSSVNAVFGGATFCAYSAANSGLEALIDAKRKTTHANSYCFDWSMWDDVGMSAANPAEATAAARAMGYHVVDGVRGMTSLFAMLAREPASILVGLNRSNTHIDAMMHTSAKVQHTLAGFVVADHSFSLDAPAHDGFGTLLPLQLQQLPSMPLDHLGQVDRRALLDMALHSDDAKQHVKPRNATEFRIAEIWKQVLGVAEPGVHDNFFQSGGHSLLATQLISRLRDAFAVHLPVSVLFESPTIAQIAASIDGEGAEVANETIKRLADRQQVPLSFSQQRLWLINQIQGPSPAYNITFALQLEGPLDRDALSKALNQVIVRHEVLRTKFESREPEPVQVIADRLELQLGVMENVDEQAVRQLCAAEAAKAFDLQQGPLLRGVLYQLDLEKKLLQLTVHHIIADGWSVGIFIEELAACYRVQLQGEPVALPTLPIQYADFAVWQRQQLQGEKLQDQLAFWRSFLADAPGLLELPLDRPRPQQASGRGASLHFELGFETSERLKRFAKSHGASETMVFHAVWGHLLSRYSGQDQVVIGMPIANRNHTQIEPLIGFFVNTLALKSDQSGDFTFTTLLKRTRDSLLQAYEHQDLPFEMLVEDLQPNRSLSHTPLFQVMLSVQNMAAGELELPNLKATLLESRSNTTRFDLTLTVADGDDGFGASLTYNTDVFVEATAQRMTQQLKSLFEALLHQPETRLSEVTLINDAEQALMRQWNQTQVAIPPDNVVTLFEAMAQAMPSATAIRAKNDTSYGELQAQVNRIANGLLAKGVQPGDAVGISFTNRLSIIASTFAVFKVGAVYVPIDPMLPEDRKSFIVKDSKCVLVVTSDTLDELDKHDGVAVTSSCDTAYIIYTSGSTGTPKGVRVSHRAFVNHLTWFNRDVLPDRDCALPFISAIAFDASLKQMFAPLIRGGAVWMPQAELLRDPIAFRKAFAQQANAALNCVPSLWETLLTAWEDDGPHVNGGPRTLMLGGETISPALVQRTFKTFPNLRLINLYGPTEACVNATWDEIKPEGEITIGRPCANTRIYLMNAQLQPVPLGAIGEICIAGDGVAEGYHNLPEQTQDRFIQVAALGERVYRTGDLGRFDHDGRLLFYGRKDHQVKVRGFRIELGEIETALTKQPGVEQAVVGVKGAGSQTYLAAFVRWQAQAKPDRVALLRGLQSILPEYMVPSVIVDVEAFARSATGKIDRNALPEIETQTSIAPRNDVEAAVAEIWCEVLRLNELGVLDNFFERGGHSLTAVQVLTRLRSRFQVELSLRFLFEEATVAAQAESLVGISRVAQDLLGESDEDEEEFAF